MSPNEPFDPSDVEFLASCYLDGQLDESQRRAFESRLESDPQLRECLADFQSIQRLIEPLAQPPELDWKRFQMQVGDRWRRETGRRRRGRMILRLTGLAAAAVLCIMVTRFVIDSTELSPMVPGHTTVRVVVGPQRPVRTVDRIPGSSDRIRFSHGGPISPKLSEVDEIRNRPAAMILAFVGGIYDLETNR